MSKIVHFFPVLPNNQDAPRDNGRENLSFPMTLLETVLSLLLLESRSLIPVAPLHILWNSLEYNLFGFMDQQVLLVVVG